MVNQWIKSIREYLNCSQKEFAKLLDSTQAQVNHVETGRIKKVPYKWAEILEKKYFICKEYTLLGIEPVFLFDRDKAKLKFIQELFGTNDKQLEFVYYNLLINPERIEELMKFSLNLKL